VKIVHVETVVSCGRYSKSADWRQKKAHIHEAVRKCDWPPGSGKFTIYPVKDGNGVVPIKKEFVAALKKREWVIEGPAKNKIGQDLGDFDAVIFGKGGPVIAEWETGNISSSHRSMNKITMLVSDGLVAAGVLVVPSRKLYEFLTDRIGNYRELEPYLKLWKSVPCKSGVVEIVVIEQDAESMRVSPIPKSVAGRSKKAR
jgi:Restriction endonuclease BamHI